MTEEKISAQPLKSRFDLSAVYPLAFKFIQANFPLYFELFNTVFVRFLILGLGFTATTIITRVLSVEDRGKYAILINLVYLFMTFFSFGFHTSIVYQLSR